MKSLSNPAKITVFPINFTKDKYFNTLDTVKNTAWEIMVQAGNDIKQYTQDDIPDKLIRRYLSAKMMYQCYDDMSKYYIEFKTQNGKFEEKLPSLFFNGVV